ncbi:hypothetical protein [Aquimarina sp. MMG016]|uniref:hypothetical protein n=1 Tax=Aquimarina sp. MMG016 TaxID=2822690 RepID=UPI001B3A4CB7|nr:hypothetical protein [Aquimarina sp. MMG016]MBQ4821955.1 hypothetical protein [Aquimarina sp. MMG016]
MRRVINLCVLICAVVFSTSMKAADVLSVKIGTASTIHVSLSNAAIGQQLYLKSYEGDILFNVTLQPEKTFVKSFDLELLQDGIYFVETETEFEIKVTPVLKNNKGVALINNSVTTIFKPAIDKDNGMINVMFTNAEKSQVNLYIYDKEDVLLHEEVISKNEDIIKRSFDFSKVPSGEYKVYFKLKDRTFIERVSI